MKNRLVIQAAIILAIAVVLGAFGAHGLKARISFESLGQWKTGVEYHLYHGLGLLLIAGLGDRIGSKAASRIGWFFLFGIICFSGSLYLLSTRELSGWSWVGSVAGPITPLGGLLFVAGWVQLAFAAWRKSDKG